MRSRSPPSARRRRGRRAPSSASARNPYFATTCESGLTTSSDVASPGVAKTQCSVGTAPDAGSTKATLAISATEASNSSWAASSEICPRAAGSSCC